MPAQENVHATAVVLGDRGVLIKGDSGSGKTSLALTLVRHCRAAGWFARLVSDDQVFLSVRHARLVAHAPEAIAGLAEFRGVGPRPISYERQAVIDLMVCLSEAGQTPRFNDDQSEIVLGVNVRRLLLPARNDIAPSQAVLAVISVPPFG